MEKIILLPGNSPLNKEWIYEIDTLLKSKGVETFVLEYAHWETGENMINFNDELSRLKAALPEGFMKASVIAKSAGVVLTGQAIKTGLLVPKSCIFIGTPVTWTKKIKITPTSWIKGHSIPTLFVSKPLDPAYHFNKMLPFLEENAVGNYETWRYYSKGEPEDNHHYANVPLLVEKALAFIAKA